MSATHALPDPRQHAGFYDSVPTKRLLAWIIDLVITAALAAALSLPALILGVVLILPLLLIPLFWCFTGFLYRWWTISSGSATWGMRMMAIELRDRDGLRLDGQTAFLHTAGTYLSFAISPLQLVSVAAMVLSERRQGLTDMVLGTVMLNRAAR